MRRFLVIGALFLVAMSARADEWNTEETVNYINTTLAADAFYGTHGYEVALITPCILELIPRGSEHRNARRQRLALHVLDRVDTQGVRPHFRNGRRDIEGAWIHLVGKPELKSGRRRGFPSSIDMDESGFPKEDEAMISYGVEFRLHDPEAARGVAQAFVTLAAYCTDEQL